MVFTIYGRGGHLGHVTIILEDLKVLWRSPDLFNNVKIGQGFTAYNKTFCFTIYGGCSHFGQVT